jgi:hypothetical protein
VDYLDAMRAFVQTAHSGTMSAAARDLGISVALLSKRIARLEARLGARLFHRTTRRMSLSDPGQAYVDRAQQILADIEDAESQVAGLQNEPRGELRVSASVTFGRKHIVPLVARLLTRFLAARWRDAVLGSWPVHLRGLAAWSIRCVAGGAVRTGWRQPLVDEEAHEHGARKYQHLGLHSTDGNQCGTGAIADQAPADAKQACASDKPAINLVCGWQCETTGKDRVVASCDPAKPEMGHEQSAAHDKGE